MARSCCLVPLQTAVSAVLTVYTYPANEGPISCRITLETQQAAGIRLGQLAGVDLLADLMQLLPDGGVGAGLGLGEASHVLRPPSELQNFPA